MRTHSAFYRAAYPLALLLLTVSCSRARTAYRAQDPELRALPVFLYPADTATGPARGLVFFFGNDVGFWKPHQELAERMAAQRFNVVGLDVRQFLETLPTDPPARRDSAFAASIDMLVKRARHELGADSLPVVIAGHSIGAELALWTAAHAPPPGLRGVLALSPGSRGHVAITVSDMMNGAEPTGPGSFSVAAQVESLPPAVRVSLVRGQRDRYRFADPAFAAVGGTRFKRFLIPFSGHSLKKLVVAGPFIQRALDWAVAKD